jgi:hypothetical protein
MAMEIRAATGMRPLPILWQRLVSTIFETIPERLLVKAALVAASQLPGPGNEARKER